ncbi:MAG: hypothetical protein LBR20_03415 [Propionibacteriaceae bacterium]|jgi:hypothetical protein|nr:hypothetical protein [Propionibacteriaceae bacterium]
MATTTTDQRRYEFVLPPGWFRFDMRRPLDPQISRYVDALVEGRELGDKRALVKANLRSAIGNQLAEAEGQEALDLVLPTLQSTGVVSTASFAVFPLKLPDESDPVEFIAAIASRDTSATLVEVEDLVALRTEAKKPADFGDPQQAIDAMINELGVADSITERPQAADTTFSSHRVVYFIGHPERSEGWVIFAFSVIEQDNDEFRELSDLLIELFDQIMLTVRFNG